MATLRCLEKCQCCALRWELFLDAREAKIVRNNMLDVLLLCLIHLCLARGCNTMILCVVGSTYAVTFFRKGNHTTHALWPVCLA